MVILGVPHVAGRWLQQKSIKMDRASTQDLERVIERSLPDEMKLSENIYSGIE